MTGGAAPGSDGGHWEGGSQGLVTEWTWRVTKVTGEKGAWCFQTSGLSRLGK